MLSATARYALRALVHLATMPDGKSLLGRDLSQIADIPPNYLSKILWTLGSAGFIGATRGTGGGYRLQRPPGDIRLVEIVELFDPARIANGCLLDTDHPCTDGTACAAHESWKHVKAVYSNFLETTTLAVLVSNHAARGPQGEAVL
jgi:Rrf2 family transcriptional regulator, nitric oxide-sensitive transcriptional repressor